MTLSRRGTYIAVLAACGLAAWFASATFVSNAGGGTAVTLEDFKCFGLDPAGFRARDVTLQDQFQTYGTAVQHRSEICNPVAKNGVKVQNRRAHLVCYTITGPAVNRNVVVQNQFGQQQLHVNQPAELCLPSRKRLLTQTTLPAITNPIDHYQCYGVDQLTAVNPPPVRLRDEFGLERQVPVGPAIQLCTPTSKNGGGIINQTTHLVCYGIVDPAVNLGIEIKNQFERRKLTANAPRKLCVPSTKQVLPG